MTTIHADLQVLTDISVPTVYTRNLAIHSVLFISLTFIQDMVADTFKKKR